ncbi:glycosyltransferase [Natronomonas marina]|uniref:glycosyltransferase n=1 Tax=Natronomonas marina TaxID=2961939 RepID=UPI0020C9BDEB|nr:glycosyltransferase [Natronomonas marina]
MSGKDSGDTVWRFANTRISSEKKEGEFEIDDNYTEYRYKNLIHSGVSALTENLDIPNIYNSSILDLSDPEYLVERAHEAQVIIVERPWQWNYIKDISRDDAILIYSSHDFLAERFSYVKRTIGGDHILSKIKSVEQKAVEEADMVIVTSERDKKMYINEFNIKDKYYVSPNATYKRSGLKDSITEVEVKGRRFQNSSEKTFALFVGGGHRPNIRAVEEIFQMAKMCDELIFMIVGDVCDHFDESETPSNLVLLSFVEDLSNLYSFVDVALNPIINGSGTNIKLLEYFSYGLPVISTPFGARGIDAKDGTHYWEATISEFPEVLGRYHSNQISGDKLSKECKNLIDNRLNWETVSENLMREIKNHR